MIKNREFADAIRTAIIEGTFVKEVELEEIHEVGAGFILTDNIHVDLSRFDDSEDGGLT